MKQINVLFDEMGEITIQTGSCSLGEMIIAAKLLNMKVDASINQYNIENYMRENMDTVIKIMEEKGLIQV